MAKPTFSSKRVLIDKANATVTIVVALTSFITISSVVVSRSMLVRRSYQARVIKQKEKARDQLKANLDAVDTLVASYKEFVERPKNIIGGDPNGTDERAGDNAKLTLDALPSKYDFPALTTSLEKLATQKHLAISAIKGVDDEVAQKKQDDASPKPVEMPISIIVTGPYSSYDTMHDLIKTLEDSIRPFQMQKLIFTASEQDKLELQIDSKTFYLPEKTLSIKKETVK
jgi:hypothetical protein